MVTQDIQEITLRRKLKVIVEPGVGALPLEYVATSLKNIEQLGFTFEPELIKRLCTLGEAELGEFYASTIKTLKSIVGDKVEHAPMYPNFPKQVMEASRAELYINAIMHYLGDVLGLRIMPEYEKLERAPLAKGLELKAIGLTTLDEVATMTQNLIGANASISETDKADLKRLIAFFSVDIAKVLPSEIPQKENLAFVTSLLLDDGLASDVLLTNYFKTATDVLRLAVALSEGDVSLAASTKFKSFKRRERRLILSLLDRIKFPLEDMGRYPKRWIRLGERLHPGEYKKQYPNAFEGFAFVRAGKKFRGFNSKVEAALLAKDLDAAIELLVKRPGELARRLDHLIRLGALDSALAAFESISDRLATPLLLQLNTHFRHRDNPPAIRAVFPKGSVGKVMALPNEVPALPKGVAKRIQSLCEATLIKRFGEMEPLGKVYLDDEMDRFNVPFSQRSASKSLRTLVRGSRVPLPEGSTVRLFLWWKEGKVEGADTGRVDVDLSAVIYGEDWDYKEHVSYTNLKSTKYQAAHSGDITSAPKGASEFIDLDIQSMLDYGARYVVMNAISYTRQAFVTMPECYVGWMMRTKPQSGEIYEPKTVVDKLDLGADTKFCIPLILDLEAREIIWCDVALKSRPRWNNVEENRTSIIHMGRALTTMRKTTLHDLFSLHAKARGELVDSAEEADTVFSPKAGITPFEVEKIMAEFLAN